MQMVKRVFLSRLTVKLLTVVLFFFLIFPPLKPVMDGLVKIVLLWGGFQLAVDLLTKKTFLRARNVVWLLLFLFMETVTIALNYPTGLKDNLSLLCYTAVGMLVLYPNGEEQSRETLLREMWLIGWVYILLCTAASLVSLLTLWLGVSGTVEYGNVTYHIGVFGGRLWGVYSNPNFPAALLAAALSLLQLPVCRAAARRPRLLPAQYGVLAVCFFLNFWYLALAQSRGSLAALAVFIAVFLFFVFGKTVLARLHRFAVSCAAGAAAAVGSAALTVLAAAVLLQAGNGLERLDRGTVAEDRAPPAAGNSAVVPLDSPLADDPILGEDSLGRDEELETSDTMTGRPILWKMGWERFLKKPVFGYGNVGATEGVEYHWSSVKHYHNVLVHSLVATGLAGTLPLVAFAAATLVSLLRQMSRDREKSLEETGVACALLALLALYLVHNMIEMFLIYAVSLPHFLFWIYLGYMVSLLPEEERLSKIDRRLRRLADKLPAIGKAGKAGDRAA